MGVNAYRKKAVVIEATRWDGTAEGATPIIDWMLAGDGTARFHEGTDDDHTFLSIDTLEGMMTAGSGDWIIRGVKGEFYPCKHDVFEASYDMRPLPLREPS